MDLRSVRGSNAQQVRSAHWRSAFSTMSTTHTSSWNTRSSKGLVNFFKVLLRMHALMRSFYQMISVQTNNTIEFLTLAFGGLIPSAWRSDSLKVPALTYDPIHPSLTFQQSRGKLVGKLLYLGSIFFVNILLHFMDVWGHLSACNVVLLCRFLNFLGIRIFSVRGGLGSAWSKGRTRSRQMIRLRRSSNKNTSEHARFDTEREEGVWRRKVRRWLRRNCVLKKANFVRSVSQYFLIAAFATKDIEIC